ncbi:SFT2-domain-containing protein [Suillus bovinus]|uniref:SFT2-domain-containing protein n=1 Tax=Suillus bovinus TaxID=48563 RepID=UPI001B885598|nr:SFT2-domain-containing protein [Suillus bovinus]KAG2158136.1 SFT2-domain-containing protein [Suillus bovinus]
MPSKGWFNLESAGGMIPETQFFEGDSAFKFLGLTRTQRLYGFSWLSHHWLGSFAVLYTIGILVSLIGTGFVIGFASQIKLMFKPVRIIATVVFLGSVGLVFVGAFVLKNEVLCIIFVIIEYLAYTWYNLSYIPYARSAVLKLVGMS